MNISLAMIVKNVDTSIKRCLDSVQSLVDEIVIIDTGSDDSTIEIIKEYSNIHLYYFPWVNDFSKARNFSIEKCTGDYILVLDADEYVIKGSRESLEELISKKEVGQIEIQSIFEMNGEILEANASISRFFPRTIRYYGNIHEQLDTNIPKAQLDLVIKHDGYYKNKKNQRNIPLLLKAIQDSSFNAYNFFQLGKEYRMIEEFKKAYDYLILAYNNVSKFVPYYPDLVVEIIECGKSLSEVAIINIINDNEEILDNMADFHFASGLFYLEYAYQTTQDVKYYLDLVENKFLKCMELNSKTHIERVKGTSSFLASYNLGVLYEVTGNKLKAKKYYHYASEFNYNRAISRLNSL